MKINGVVIGPWRIPANLQQLDCPCCVDGYHYHGEVKAECMKCEGEGSVLRFVCPYCSLTEACRACDNGDACIPEGEPHCPGSVSGIWARMGMADRADLL